MPCRVRKWFRIGPRRVGARNMLGFEVIKLLTMSPFYAFLSLKLKLDLPRRNRKKG